VVAIGSTLLALAAIALGYYLYARRYPELQKLPTALRPDDPLRRILGRAFTVFENKYWVDELYKAVILDPTLRLPNGWRRLSTGISGTTSSTIRSLLVALT